jgi:ATP-dependent DNA helicase RecG
MPEDADFLSTPLQFLKGVGPRRAADLRRVGLETVEDLVYRFPFRYEDRSRLAPIGSLQPTDQRVSVAGEVVQCAAQPGWRSRASRTEALVKDDSGYVRVVWFNQPYLRDVFARGKHVVLYGKVEVYRGHLQMTSPAYEFVEADEVVTAGSGRIVPVYEKAGDLSAKVQRKLVREALDRLPDTLEDPLPVDLRARLDLPPRRQALLDTHFPPDDTPLDALNLYRTPGQRRLIFEEFLLFQIGILLRRREAAAVPKAFVPVVNDAIRESARRVLPFHLTAGQKQALAEIVGDMQQPTPMNRLLQGDVGAGKTIVALLAAVVAMENGLQVAFMAPTEILAEQHDFNLRRLLEGSRFRVELLTGAIGAATRRVQRAAIASGDAHLVVGTHALVQEGVTFHRLGFVVIDEQHRFGVLQRATLREKGLNPDVLVMTATPIPRTLALTVHGDLDVSVIRDLPPGRRPIRTMVRPEAARAEVYEIIRAQIEEGRQAYVVYPLVEESAKVDLRAATEMADHLATDVFPEFRVALLHGRMKQNAKDRVMKAFAAGDLHILVATTVVEEGIDVPNAAVMVIEHAERFGLSQLHQLRGRVGRGRHQSSCILLHQAPLSEEGAYRLKAMAETADGFVIAERDMELRGPGDLAGTRQSGLPALRVGDLVRDRALMEDARREARAWLAQAPEDDLLVAFVRRTWAPRFGLAEVG